MIKILEGFPANIVALAAHGHVTRDDYLGTVIPKVESALQGGGKVRIYYEIGADYAGFGAGAAWEDFKLGMEHLRAWERIALVSDVEWIRLAMHAFQFMLPGEIRLFPLAEAAEAKRWITA